MEHHPTCHYCGGDDTKITFVVDTGQCYCDRCGGVFVNEETQQFYLMQLEELQKEEERLFWARQYDQLWWQEYGPDGYGRR